ncbi:9452_t:CDS:2 [Entrophospora sp. SA101]|nr:9452_t:CDS:2 [Entrophospora sp. SA101]
MQKSEITAKRTRTAISVKLKKEICEYMMAHRNVKHADVASFFNNKYKELNIDIDRTSISKIFKDKDKWLNLVSDMIGVDKFRQHSTRFPEFVKAMQIWTAQMVSAGMPLSDLILQRKGEEFARGLNIENQIKCANERSKLQFILSQYNEEDIYNADETGIFFRMQPNQTLSTGPISGYKKWLNYHDRFFCAMDRKVVLLIDNAGSHFNPKQLEQSNENSTIVNDHNEEIIIINEESSSCSDNEEPIAESSHFDQNVPTKEYLNDEEIISLVQFEKMDENGNDSSSDEEIPLIPVKNAINGLETFINFFEQQKNNEKFKIDDLHIF